MKRKLTKRNLIASAVVVVALLVGVGIGSAGKTKTVTHTRTVTVTKTQAVARTRRVVPRECSEAIAAARAFALVAGRAFAIAAKYPPMLAQVGQAVLANDVAQVQRIAGTVQTSATAVEALASRATRDALAFRVAAAGCC